MSEDLLRERYTQRISEKQMYIYIHSERGLKGGRSENKRETERERDREKERER